MEYPKEGFSNNATRENKRPILDREIFLIMKNLFKDKFSDFIQKYLNQLDIILMKIEKAIKENETLIIKNEAHKLKSSSAQVGASRLHCIMRKIEKSGELCDIPNTQLHLKRALKEQQILHQVIQEILKNESSFFSEANSPIPFLNDIC